MTLLVTPDLYHYYPQFGPIVKWPGEKNRLTEGKTSSFSEKVAICNADLDVCPNTPFWARSVGGHFAHCAAEELPTFPNDDIRLDWTL